MIDLRTEYCRVSQPRNLKFHQINSLCTNRVLSETQNFNPYYCLNFEGRMFQNCVDNTRGKCSFSDPGVVLNFACSWYHPMAINTVASR